MLGKQIPKFIRPTDLFMVFLLLFDVFDQSVLIIDMMGESTKT